MSAAIKLEFQNQIALITLNRPKSMNAINEEMRKTLPQAMQAAQVNPAVRVIVLCGAGDRAFCAGADIKEFSPVQSQAAYRQERHENNWIGVFDRTTKPIIAAIQGYCLGGGLEMALACDIRVAQKDAFFGFPETGNGMIPGAGGTQRIARMIGLGRALDLVLTGERISAERAYEIGLVSRLTDVGSLTETALQVAQRVSSHPDMAIKFAKEAVLASASSTLSAGLEKEIDLLSLLMNSEERLGFAREFIEKSNNG